ncbi:MAG: hypothetical protein ACI8ZN_001913 [Bacteroidia bacterium]
MVLIFHLCYNKLPHHDLMRTKNVFQTTIRTIALCLLAFQASAQNYVDLAKFDYTTTSLNTFDTAIATTTLTEINGDLTAPIVLNSKITVLTGVSFEQTKGSFNPGRSEETLTGLTLKCGANIKHNSKLSGTYMLLPKISSDFKNINRRDFQLGAVALMKYEKSDHFNYKFGAYVNQELFGTFVVPIFGMYYLSATEKFEAKVLLPLSVDLNYTVLLSTKLGINFRGQIRSYNINTQVLNEEHRYLARATNEVFAYAQYELKSGINLQLSVGRSIGRSYRIYNEKVAFGMPLIYFGDDRQQLNTDFSDSWLCKATVFYRLHLQK